jgi:hypothetical protein
MTYILMIWTVVAMAGDRHVQEKAYEWRPIGEFHMEEGRMNKKTALEMCEEAARQLGLKSDRYRCVRSK